MVSLEERIEQLVAYEEENGHLFVPYGYKEKNKLGFWVNNMRAAHKKGKLSKDKVAQLEDIGFAWTSPKGPEKDEAITWGKQFRWVVNFHKAKGHSNVPSKIGGQAVPAAAWCDEQRQLHLSGKLSQDKFAKLTKLDFDFYGSSKEDDEPVSTIFE